MTSPTKFCHMTQIILWMWSCDQSLATLAYLYKEDIITSILQRFDEKNRFFWWMILVQVQWLGTGTSYSEILHQSVKRFKTKSQKVLGAHSYVCRSYRGRTGRETFLPPILNRVNIIILRIIITITISGIITIIIFIYLFIYSFIIIIFFSYTVMLVG